MMRSIYILQLTFFVLHSASAFATGCTCTAPTLNAAFLTQPPKKAWKHVKMPLLKRSYCKHHRPRVTELNSVLSLRGGAAEITDLISSSYDWGTNLGAPAALVAGAVVGTLYEKLSDPSYMTTKKDGRLTMFAKRFEIFLLATAFALEIISIFVTTVTGTMLLTIGDRGLSLDTSMNAPLKFLMKNFEFEYLTSRISFLQGLLNWIAAIGINFAICKERQGKATRKMDKAIGAGIMSIILVMLSFYNGHMNFYKNYPHMLSRWLLVSWKRYTSGKFRPMALLIIPSFAYSGVLTYQAFASDSDEKLEEES